VVIIILLYVFVGLDHGNVILMHGMENVKFANKAISYISNTLLGLNVLL